MKLTTTILSLVITTTLIINVLGDLPSCSRARCSHCEADLIARLCPGACAGCPVSALRFNSPPKATSLGSSSKPVVHGQPNVNSAHGELHPLPQAPGAPPQLLSQPQPQPLYPQQPQAQFQPQPQPQPYYPQPQPQPQSFNFQQPQAPAFPQQPYPNYQQPYGQTPFYNPFQPFLGQAYQPAPSPFNPFTFPTFAPVTFAPVTAAPVTAAPPPPQLPTYRQPQPYVPPPQPYIPPQPQRIEGGQNQQTGNYYHQVEQVKPKQIYNQQPPPPPASAPPPQVATPLPQPAVYPAPPPPPAVVASSIDSGAISAIAEKPAPSTCPRANWEPCITKELANDRFRNCCQRLGDGCAQICSYDQTLATIQIAVLTGRCPISKVADMMVCASGYEDATACCQAYGVFEPGFEQCRPYCNPAAGLPNDGMLAEKYRCLGKMSHIQRCFYVSQRL